MRRLIATIALLLATTGVSAQTTERAADAAALDVLTTAAGLAMGAAEANPVGLLTLPGKLIALDYAQGLPTGEREHALSVISAVWRGAAANNLCIVVAIATGGAFGPACAVAGLAVALREWESTAIERQFWAVCAWHRQTQPDLKCTYITTPA